MGYKIAFTGTFSTGKTTTLDSFLAEYKKDDVICIREVARKANRLGFPLGKLATTETYVYCTNEQLKQLLDNENANLLIADRSILDTYAHALLCQNALDSIIPDYLIEFLLYIWRLECKKYDMYFYFPIEFLMTTDGVRSDDEKYRAEIDNTIKTLLVDWNIPYITVTGSINKRVNTIIQYLENGL